MSKSKKEKISSERGETKAKKARTMREIKRRVDRLQLQELPVETLEQIDQELLERQQEIADAANELEEKLDYELSVGRGLSISEHRLRIRWLFKEHREHERERVKVYDARQERILEDGLIRVLGSKARVKALEWFIISLIIGVVSMLFYDLACEDPPLSEETKRTIALIDVVACVIFLAEFFFRHHFAESKRWFWRRHWIDFATSIPLPHISHSQLVRFGRLVRLTRFVRLVRLVRLLRVLRVIFFFWRGMDKLQDVFDVRLMKRSLAITISILVIGAALIWVSESGGADTVGVDSFSESIWWSFTTVVTGGFGDIHNPQTVGGRLVTVVLIIAGMIVVGIFIATLTSVLVGDESGLLLANQHDMSERLDRISEQLEIVAGKAGVELPEDLES